MVVAYQVGQARQIGLQIYQQHLHYIQAHGLDSNPREPFQVDIHAAIRHWIEYGVRIIIFIDMNKHILTGHLARSFQSLGLQEATHHNWERSEPRTYIFGKG